MVVEAVVEEETPVEVIMEEEVVETEVEEEDADEAMEVGEEVTMEEEVVEMGVEVEEVCRLLYSNPSKCDLNSIDARRWRKGRGGLWRPW